MKPEAETNSSYQSHKPRNSRVFPMGSPPINPSEEDDPCASPSASDFPFHALPGIFSAMAKAGAKASNTPESMAACLVLAASSVAMGAGVELDCGGSFRCRGTLHLIGIAESGTGKSEAMKVIFAPINAAQKKTSTQWEQTERPRQRARAAMLKKQETRKDANLTEDELTEIFKHREAAERAASDNARPLVYAANVTSESLAAAFSVSPNQAFAVVNPDARGLLGVIAGKYSGGKSSDEAIYLAGYSGDAMSSLRVGSGYIDVEHPCLAMCLMIQPDVLADLQSKSTFAESGWLQRCLIFDSRASYPPLAATSAQVPVEISQAWKTHIDDKLDNYRNSETTFLVTPSDETREYMLRKINEIRSRMEDGDLKDFRSFACRWAEQAHRIALILHSAHFSTPSEACEFPLQLGEMVDAWVIIEWFANRQLRLLGSMRQEKNMRRLEHLIQILKQQGDQNQMPRWKLKDRGYEEEELLKLAEDFPKRLEIGGSSGSKGGRHSKWIRAKH